MADTSDQLLGPLLKDVSRSFYFTLRLLPAVIRRQIGLAYLLARTSDTIADTEIIPLPDRLEALETLRDRILGRRDSQLNLKDFSPHQGSAAERQLLDRANESIALLSTFDAGDQARIRNVLSTILSGQELDLRRFAGANSKSIVALKSAADLDDYTFRVAGCVGDFWTQMLLSHILKKNFRDQKSFTEFGIRFGKGLQLVNILRDLPADLRQGRCYLPADDLATHLLQPADLLDSASESRVSPIFSTYLDVAEAHLEAGWVYTTRLPNSQFRLKIACALPIVLGFETLALLRNQHFLSPERRIKVSRSRLRNILIRLFIFYPWAGPWRHGPRRC